MLADVLSVQEVVDRSNAIIGISDPRLTPYLADALAQAALYAPCLQSDTVAAIKVQQAKGIIADAVLRRFERDTQPEQGIGLAAETWTAGPLGRSINYVDNTNSGLPLLTKADRDQLVAICRRRAPYSIAVGIPTIVDPSQSGWPMIASVE